MGKYFPETARHAKAQEFLELKQGATRAPLISQAGPRGHSMGRARGRGP